MSYQFLPHVETQGQPAYPKNTSHAFSTFEGEDTGRDKDEESDDPGRIKGVTAESLVHLVRAVKDAQMEDRCCYHCSSPEHFIYNCLLIKTLRENTQLNGRGDGIEEGNLDPSHNSQHTKELSDRGFQGIKLP